MRTLVAHLRRHVVAYIAILISLSGTSYAALLVTGQDVVDGSLTGRDVRDRSLT